MNQESQTAYTAATGELKIAADAIGRAMESFTPKNWDNLTLGYVQAQLCRANRKIVSVVEGINNEINGRFEGAPEGAHQEEETQPQESSDAQSLSAQQSAALLNVEKTLQQVIATKANASPRMLKQMLDQVSAAIHKPQKETA